MPRGIHTLLAIAAGAVLGAGVMLVRGVSADRTAPPVAPPAPYAQASLLEEVTRRVRNDYVDSVSGDQLDRAAVDGMLASLDPHSSFLDGAEYEAIRVSTTGHYSGVGLEAVSYTHLTLPPTILV